MMWNTIPNDERLRLWKTLRSNIEELTLESQLKEIAKFCSRMPIGTRTLDYYDPVAWPTPWEILFYGSFCTSSISLLIFYTFNLLYTGINAELYLVDDNNDIYLLPIIDNKFVLNYELGSVNNYSEIQDDFKILRMYREEIRNIT